MILTPTTPHEEVLRACQLLMAPGDVHEVRIPKAGRRGTISGYFNDPAALAEAVMLLDGTVPGIYITLNPCTPALLARAANRLKERVQVTTSDADIRWRRWLPFDFDPVRPAGISSTDFEHGRAIACACGTWDHLRGPFRDPAAIADSGNGCYLLHSIDLPNNEAATRKLKCILENVAALCAPDDVSIDQTMFNASRIVRLFGTKNCKGDSTVDRPHRRSRLLETAVEL